MKASTRTKYTEVGPDTVEVSLSRYVQLVNDSSMAQALQAAGLVSGQGCSGVSWCVETVETIKRKLHSGELLK